MLSVVPGDRFRTPWAHKLICAPDAACIENLLHSSRVLFSSTLASASLLAWVSPTSTSNHHRCCQRRYLVVVSSMVVWYPCGWRILECRYMWHCEVGPRVCSADVWLSSVTMSLSLPNLIVRSALRQYLREERLMDDAEIGLMLAGRHPCR